MPHIYLESHGVQLDVEVEDEANLAAVEAILPPAWRPSDQFPEDGHLTLATGPAGTHDVVVDGAPIATDMTAEVAVHVIDAEIRAKIALLSRAGAFIHAGVVQVGEQAIVLPAPSFSGKSSLVAALVATGATYFSDEFAVLDDDGRVHPYAKPLSMRSGAQRYGEIMSVESIGGRSGEGPVRVGLIAVTHYAPGGRWNPEQRSSGAGALALLSNAVAARSRPEAIMRAVNRAAAQALVLEGARGDALETAQMLVAKLVSLSAP